MDLAHTLPFTPILRRRARSGPSRLRRWLDRLQRLYGRAGMLELHR
jgi:hypothetical protein